MVKNPEQVYETPGNYPISLMLVSEHGCKDTVVKVLTIDEELLIWVPNSFSPNGDGINETFKPKGSGIKSYDIMIFDRWGSVIHNASNKEWDGTFKGTLCQDQIYVYKLTIIDIKGIRREIVGHVTLLK
jgi:gliding motility-associated-like protein